MTHYTITTNDGSEYPVGREIPVPEDVLVLFDAKPEAVIGIEAQQDPDAELIEVVYLRRKDIRSATYWREVNAEASAPDAPVASASSGDGPQE